MENLCVFPIIAGAGARSATSSQHQCADLAAEFHRNSGKPNPNPLEARGLAYSAVAWGSRGRPPEPSIRGGEQLDWALPRRGGIKRTHRAPPPPPPAAAPHPKTPAGGAAARSRGLPQAPAPAPPSAARTPWGLPSFSSGGARRRSGGGEGEEARRLETRGFSLLRLSLSLFLSPRGFSLSLPRCRAAREPLGNRWAGPACKWG